MSELDHSNDPTAERPKLEYRAKLALASVGDDPHESAEKKLLRLVVPRARRAIADLRRNGKIGDEAYRRVEQELDWLEVSTQA